MSCITKLLEAKGSKEFYICENGVALEGGGIYRDYEWCVVLNDIGHRCGYVALPSSHPLHGKEYMQIDYDLDVHGGLTFSEHSHLIESECNDWWLGFDAGHMIYDKADLEAFEKYYQLNKEDYDRIKKMDNLYDNFEKDGFKGVKRTVKDFEFMRNECERLIDQLIDIESKKGDKNEL